MYDKIVVIVLKKYRNDFYKTKNFMHEFFPQKIKSQVRFMPKALKKDKNGGDKIFNKGGTV